MKVYRITTYVTGRARHYDYKTLAAAKRAVDDVARRTGTILGIEEVSLPKSRLYPASAKENPESMYITAPGKFEGCKRYAPYFYGLWNEGMADIDKGKLGIFKVTAEDRAKFPELKKRRWIRIAEDDQGFVYTT